MYKLDGRKAIITGAGGGIGRAIALRLAREGYDVGIFDRDEAGANGTAELVRAGGREAAVAVGDVARREDVTRAAAALAQALGPIDTLVNNAGILRTAPFLELTDAAWHNTFGVNLDGAFHFCQAVLPAMLARRTGAVVNISSFAGKTGLPNHAAYSASKFTLIGLTQCMAAEMAEHGIRINAVCPGIIVDTGMRAVAEASAKAEGRPGVEVRAQAVPMRRTGVPDDIARVVVFLASDEAAYMTGQAVNVTGGLWMS